MSYRAIYTYAWDLAEAASAKFARRDSAALGLDTVTLAGSYHAGKFLRPHGTDGKVYFPEDGTVYFRADPKRYGAHQAGREQHPRRARHLRRTDAADRPRGQCVAGAPPQYAARQGLSRRDRRECLRRPLRLQPLSVGAGCARLCGRALPGRHATAIRSSASRWRSPGFLPYAHGFHHEFALMKQNRWFDNQLGLCFCAHCVERRQGRRHRCRRALRARRAPTSKRWLASDFDLPDDMAEAFWLADTRTRRRRSARFLAWRCDVVTSLVGEIQAAIRKDATFAVIPSVARPTGGAWYEGSDLAALARRGRHHRGLLLRAERRARARRCLGRQAAACAARASSAASSGPPIPTSNERGEVIAAVDGAARGRHHRHRLLQLRPSARRRACDWIGDALAALGGRAVSSRARSSRSPARPAASARRSAAISARRAQRSPRSTRARRSTTFAERTRKRGDHGGRRGRSTSPTPTR